MVITTRVHCFCFHDYIYIYIYIYTSSYKKYHVKPHSSPWFSAACAAAIVNRNTLFFYTNRINLLNVKWTSDKLVIVAKGVLEASKIAYASEIKESITSHKLASHDFWQITYSNINKDKFAIPPLFNDPYRRCFLLHLKKQNCLLKTFLRFLILMTWVSLYLFFHLELIWSYITFL